MQNESQKHFWISKKRNNNNHLKMTWHFFLFGGRPLDLTAFYKLKLFKINKPGIYFLRYEPILVRIESSSLWDPVFDRNEIFKHIPGLFWTTYQNSTYWWSVIWRGSRSNRSLYHIVIFWLRYKVFHGNQIFIYRLWGENYSPKKCLELLKALTGPNN